MRIADCGIFVVGEGTGLAHDDAEQRGHGQVARARGRRRLHARPGAARRLEPPLGVGQAAAQLARGAARLRGKKVLEKVGSMGR